MTKMKTLGALFFFGGMLLTFGAVGGMEAQPDANLLVQIFTALVGLSWMFVGTRLIQD